VLSSLIGTFAAFDVVAVLTQGGPLRTTQVFATYAFSIGILSGDLPLGASISLFMLPILAVAATFILRGVIKRGSEV
jgi:multiple sugar transport system permease protein